VRDRSGHGHCGVCCSMPHSAGSQPFFRVHWSPIRKLFQGKIASLYLGAGCDQRLSTRIAACRTENAWVGPYCGWPWTQGSLSSARPDPWSAARSRSRQASHTPNLDSMEMLRRPIQGSPRLPVYLAEPIVRQPLRLPPRGQSRFIAGTSPLRTSFTLPSGCTAASHQRSPLSMTSDIRRFRAC
jgi:hypothetical protein